MRVGFTGTQKGMTDDQIVAFLYVVFDLKGIEEFHHGDCVGADEQAHHLIRAARPKVKIVGHPPDDPDHQAFCDVDLSRDPRAYLQRNSRIVTQTQVLIATPGQQQEIVRSGTWSTVRMAGRLGRPYVLILPDGDVQRKLWP